MNEVNMDKVNRIFLAFLDWMNSKSDMLNEKEAEALLDMIFEEVRDRLESQCPLWYLTGHNRKEDFSENERKKLYGKVHVEIEL